MKIDAKRAVKGPLGIFNTNTCKRELKLDCAQVPQTETGGTHDLF